jgi:hypothetical protein
MSVGMRLPFWAVGSDGNLYNQWYDGRWNSWSNFVNPGVPLGPGGGGIAPPRRPPDKRGDPAQVEPSYEVLLTPADATKAGLTPLLVSRERNAADLIFAVRPSERQFLEPLTWLSSTELDLWRVCTAR